MKTSELKLNDKNPRKISKDKLEKLKQSIQDFEIMMAARPIVIDSNNIILGGNMRFTALKALGYKEIPDNWVYKMEDLTDEQKKEFIIKDNVGFGEWDWDILKFEFDEADLINWGLEFPVDMIEDTILEAEEDDYQEPDNLKVDVVLGDLIEFECTDGRVHRLICGDSTDSDTVAKLMNGEKADITFSSPPYNVGKTPNGDEQKYLNDSDNKTNNEYVQLLDNYSKNALLFSDYLFSNIQSLSGNKIALIEHLYNLKNVYADVMIWDKQTAEPAMARKVLNSRFEYIYIFSNEAKRSIGKRDFRGTIDNIFSLNSRQGKEYAKIHKATFPIQLPSLFIENFTETSILDLFLGTGTTMVAAHQLKRKCYGCELEPKYCQVIIDRMQKFDSTIKIKINGKEYE